MRKNKLLGLLCVALLLPALISCTAKKKSTAPLPDVGQRTAPIVHKAPSRATLPARYQTSGYMTALDAQTSMALDTDRSVSQIKMGATIRSTGGPQPLWEVMKRLANLKSMTVSWASDVDQTRLVDVDIAADDGFFDAIGNLLRQVDYFYEINGKNIIVRNKTTKVYHIAVPSMTGGYTSTVGGNFLSKKDAASGTEGSVKITSPDNKFDLWANIQSNLNTIIKTSVAEQQEVHNAMNEAAQKANEAANKPGDTKAASSDDTKQYKMLATADSGSFVIDKNVGLITVTAKPSVIARIDSYIDKLKNEVYKQVAIEAKIIEVYLQDNSKIGLDWSNVLKNFDVTGTVGFGNVTTTSSSTSGRVYSKPGQFVSSISMDSLNFDVLLNALKEQGDTHVLANPKLTVMNGQPAIISVGKDVAYVKSMKRDDNNSSTNPTTTYSAETGNVVQGIALGVMANILDDNHVILHLTPITTDIENLDSNGDVPLTSVGSSSDALQLGLPHVKVREMSTMVNVTSGDMLVIGGLIDSTTAKTGSFAPGLGSIPVLKYLFGYEQKTMQRRELVILLTPKIINKM